MADLWLGADNCFQFPTGWTEFIVFATKNFEPNNILIKRNIVANATGLTQQEMNGHWLSGARPFREDSPTGLLILNRKGRIVHANPEWFRLAEELLLTGPAYRLQGDYLAACLDGWGRDIREIKNHGISIASMMRGGNQPSPIVYPGTTPGERRWFSVAALPLERISNAGILVTHNEVTGDVLREEILTRQAFFDALTNLPNYALFKDRLNQAIGHSSRSGEPLATMFIDIDDFKVINDTYGHLSGNRVLSDVARRLSSCLRECDTVGRLGGDEFGMLLPGIGTREAAVCVADKVLAALAPDFTAQDGRKFQLMASIGIAFYPMDGMSLDVLMHGADQAMYQAKETGKLQLHHSTFGFCQTCHEPEHLRS